MGEQELNKIKCRFCGEIRMQESDFEYRLQYQHSIFERLRGPPVRHKYFRDEK